MLIIYNDKIQLMGSAQKIKFLSEKITEQVLWKTSSECRIEKVNHLLCKATEEFLIT